MKCMRMLIEFLRIEKGKFKFVLGNGKETHLAGNGDAVIRPCWNMAQRDQYVEGGIETIHSLLPAESPGRNNSQDQEGRSKSRRGRA